MMSQESFNCLRHGVVPVEIALVGEAVDLAFGDFYQGKIDPAALARAMCPHPCRGGGTGLGHLRLFLPVRSCSGRGL
jgi:hypothetical protein